MNTKFIIVSIVVYLFLVLKVIAQNEIKVGFYLSPLKSINHYEVSESDYIIKSYNTFIPKLGIFIDERVNEKFHINYGFGLMTRNFGITIGPYLADSTENSTTWYTSTTGTGMLIDPEFFLHSRYYLRGNKIKPYLTFGINYYYSITLEKRIHTNFHSSSPTLLFKGNYQHINDHGFSLLFGSGFAYKRLHIAFNYSVGLNTVDKITLPSIIIVGQYAGSLEVFSKGTVIGGSVSYGIPLFNKRNKDGTE